MNRERPQSAVVVCRHLLSGQNAIVAEADFAPLVGAFFAHARRWAMVVDPLSEVMMRQALGGAALQLAFRKHAESMAWTLNFPDPPRNVFVAGRAGEGALTGRVFTEGVKTATSARLHVEIIHPTLAPSRTWVTVDGLDLLLIYEQYFRRSVQVPTRFFEIDDGARMCMVQALPGADSSWLEQLTRDEVAQRLAGPREALDEHEVHLHCGCTGEKIAQTMGNLWGDDPDSLFQGDPGVECVCPRCGVRWWIDRALFEAHRAR